MPSLRASGTGSVSSNSQVTSLAVPIGSGVAAGDLLVIVAAWNSTAAGRTFTTPAGWTVASSTTDSGASAICSVGTFYKIATGAEAGTTVTVAHSATGRCAAVSAAFQSTNGSFDVAIPAATIDNGAVGGQTSEDSPTLTGLSFTNDMAILLLGAKQDVASATGVAFTAPSGYTVAVQKSGTSSAGNNGAAAIAYKAKTDATDETSPTWTTNEAVHWLSVSIALEDTTPTGGGSSPQTLLPGFPSSTAAADGPTLVPVVTEAVGAAAASHAGYGPTLAPGAVTLLPGFASHAASASGPTFHSVDTIIPGFASHAPAASGPTFIPGARTELAGFASSAAVADGPALHPGAVTLLAGAASHAAAAYGASPGSVTLLTAGAASHAPAASGPVLLPGAVVEPSGFASHAAAADGPALLPGAVTLHAGAALDTPVAYGPTLTQSGGGGVVISAGLAGHPAVADGPTLVPHPATLLAGFSAHPAVADGPVFHSVDTIIPGFAGHPAAASGPSLHAAAAIHPGIASVASAARGPALTAAARILAGIAVSDAAALGPSGISQPVILLAGHADAHQSADQLLAAGSALSASAAANRNGALAAAGSLGIVAAASTVGISVNE